MMAMGMLAVAGIASAQDSPWGCPPKCVPVSCPVPEPKYILALSITPKKILPSGADGKQYALVSVMVTASDGSAVTGKKVVFTIQCLDNPGHKVEEHCADDAVILEKRMGKLSSYNCTVSDGVCGIHYEASEAAAQVLIHAEMEDNPTVADETQVAVGVSLAAFPDANAYVFTGTDKKHWSNEYGTTALVAAGWQIAKAYGDKVQELPAEEKAKYATKLRFTDASLERGGLYDMWYWSKSVQAMVGACWTRPHRYHRFGRDLDIGLRGLDDYGQETEVNVKSLEKAIQEVIKNDIYIQGADNFPIGGGGYFEENHYHVRILGGDTEP